MHVIIKQDSMTPSSLKKVTIKVLYTRKSDPTKPENDRTCCILPTLCTYNRRCFTTLHNKLDSYQFSWPLWVSKKFRRRTIFWRTDSLFENAGNVNRHLGDNGRFSKAVWLDTAWRDFWDLSETILPVSNTSVFWKFACWPTRQLADGRGEWWIRDCSRHGTRRSFQQLSVQFGSPVSNGDSGTWKEKSCGIQLGDEKKACISNLRFADDVFLLASSFNQLKKIKKMHGSARARNPSRQNEGSYQPRVRHSERILHWRDPGRNISSWRKKPSIWDGWFHWRIKKLSKYSTESGVRGRAFTRHPQELTPKSYLLRHRLRFFWLSIRLIIQTRRRDKTKKQKGLVSKRYTRWWKKWVCPCIEKRRQYSRRV